MDKVSVVVACYNKRAYIEQCLDSILGQSYTNTEVVVVDDGSDDGTRDWLRSAASRHNQVRVIFNRENCGVAAVRHLGMHESAGALVTTLDADDFFWSRTKIEREVDTLRAGEGDGSGPVVAYSSTVMVGAEGTPLRFPGRGAASYKIAPGRICMLTRTCAIPRDMLLRRSLYFAVGGFDHRLLMYEDWDFKIRLSRVARFIWSGGGGVAYRRHRMGLSGAGIHQHWQWRRRVLEKNLDSEPWVLKAVCRFSLEAWRWKASMVSLVRPLLRR